MVSLVWLSRMRVDEGWIVVVVNTVCRLERPCRRKSESLRPKTVSKEGRGRGRRKIEENIPVGGHPQDNNAL